MPSENPLSSQLYIKVGGQQIQTPIMTSVLEVMVDCHAHLPGMFTIRLSDQGMKILDGGPFDLTKEVEIEARTGENQKVSLIKGEITALEPLFGEGMICELVVRGYDKSHRLFRETKSKAFLNKKDSDLASEIANNAGLSSDVTTTSTVYDHIYQHNQTDLAFLLQRAWRIGFECFVAEGKLCFRKPPTDGEGVTLTWGTDLLSFNPRMSLAEQVNEVVVKGWDVEKKEAIVGQAQKGNLYPKIKESQDGAAWAGKFGNGKLTIVDQPVVSQAEANTLATARLNELSGAFVEAEGSAFRRPDIKAGKAVKIEGLGQRLSGTYLVTNVTHLYNPSGLMTTFTVRGSRTGTLTEQMRHEAPLQRWPGVLVGVVTNTNDPKTWGRVKVKFPTLTDEAESDWARVIGLGGGPEAGMCLVPEVGDEVLVAFEHGDFSRPIVLGGVWNGKDKIPPRTADAATGEKPLVRVWQSRTGHLISMHDNADKKVEIKTKEGHSVLMDDANQKIVITSKNGHVITLDDGGNKIVVESKGQLEMKSSTNMKIEAGGNLDIKASGQVNVKGAMVNLN